MTEKSIAIIGAGMGGLAAGIYGQASGYRTRIFEAHRMPGGQAATWKRSGYSFDGCLHHLFGCRPGSRLNGLWTELGAMPRALVPTRECVAVMAPDGRTFTDYYDLDLLGQHLRDLSPRDERVTNGYVRAIRRCARQDFFGEMVLGSKARLLAMAPSLLGLHGWLRPTMGNLGARFTDPFLQRAFRLVEYSAPEVPVLMHLVKHAYGMSGDIAWPLGGMTPFARSMADRYEALGGDLELGRRVTEILTKDGRAVGVRLDDGEEVRSDVVISNADGRATIMELLKGRFLDDRVRAYCRPPADVTNWAVHVFLGVDRDLSHEPSALVMLLDKPVVIAGHTCESLEMQMYGMDSTMAPPGKGVIKVELVSGFSYWEKLASDQAKYVDEKQRVADSVIRLLERRWPGLGSSVEVVDVPTLLTWKRYMGGFYGFNNMPAKPLDIVGSLSGKLESTLPGLSGFYFVGAWATSAGALFMNALSGRKVIRAVCHKDGVPFAVPCA